MEVLHIQTLHLAASHAMVELGVMGALRCDPRYSSSLRWYCVGTSGQLQAWPPTDLGLVKRAKSKEPQSLAQGMLISVPMLSLARFVLNLETTKEAVRFLPQLAEAAFLDEEGEARELTEQLRSSANNLSTTPGIRP